MYQFNQEMLDFTIRPHGDNFLITPGFPSHRWIPLTDDPLGMLRRIHNRIGDHASLINENTMQVYIIPDNLVGPIKNVLFNSNNIVAMDEAWNQLTRE